MVVAEFGFVLVPLVMLVGVIAFFVFIATVVFKAIAGGFRAIFGVGPDAPAEWSQERGICAARNCEEPRCGHSNPPMARFCARCGSRLRHRDLFG